MIEDVLPDYRRWLYRTAYDLLPHGSSEVDDVAQEGLIAMWKAYETFDANKGSLPSWITRAARVRMVDVAQGRGQYVGHEAVRGRRTAEATSLEAELEADAGQEPGHLALEGVEYAAHRAEIHEAVGRLSGREQEYIRLRFWANIDPTSRSPQVKALREEFPILKERWHWQRAGDKLRRDLQHLADAA